MVVCVFLSSTAPPPACTAKEGDNKTFAVIRGIISQSFSDLRTNPEVKQPQREQLPRWFPMKTIRQQIYRGVIVCNQVAQAQSACMSMCVPGLYCTHAFMRASDEGPSETKRRVCSVSCIGNQHFLHPVARGSATIAVPLSLDIQAAPREEGRGRGEGAGGWSSRLHKGRGRKRRCGCVHWLFCLNSSSERKMPQKKAVFGDRRRRRRTSPLVHLH